MDPQTKPIAREPLRALIEATRAATAPSHAHVVRRSQVARNRHAVREPSALRGLVLVVLLALAIRWLVLWAL